MAKIKIGISTYGRNEENELLLPSEYVDAVKQAGALPYLLPPVIEEVTEWLAPLDMLLLAGGGDINPALYGEQPHETVYCVDYERDRTEKSLVSHVFANNMPTLAICRGMQMINVALGGSLYQHIPDVFGEQVSHRAPPRRPTYHSVTVTSPSRLSDMVQKSQFEVPTWHHQAIKTLAAPLTAVAFAEDGVIEAFEHASHTKLIALQWHPELSNGEYSCAFFIEQLIATF